MRKISVTHYVKRQRAAIPSPPSSMTVEEVLTDMFRRLRAGAFYSSSGLCSGLIIYTLGGTGSDKVIYRGLGVKMVKFIEEATKSWRAGVKPGMPGHDTFLRQCLLEATGHFFSLHSAQFYGVRAMDEGDFLAAIALSIECGENVTDLIAP